MAQPQWNLLQPSNLGSIPEGVFYQVPLQASVPGDPGEPVYYQLIAGQLPEGIQVRKTGLIEGIPSVIAQGVPSEVSTEVTRRFAIRAYTEKIVSGRPVIDRISDRTFTLTVTGPDLPEFVTPAGRLYDTSVTPSRRAFWDGTQASIQIETSDPDPDDQIVVSLLSGQLPPGLSLSRGGLISGIINPLPAGLAKQDFNFVLEITDGTGPLGTNTRAFFIEVYNRTVSTADTTDFTADDTFVTADVVPIRAPVITTPEGSLGVIRADNFYAFKFDAIDFDGDPIQYMEVAGESLPPGLNLQLDATTGWLYGYIPDQGITDVTYEFALQVKKANITDAFLNPLSKVYRYSFRLIGNIDTEVRWITNSDLGTINNGSVSTLEVQAVAADGRELVYQLAPGSNSRLPQGLRLLPSGHIAGRVSFNTFALDGGTTTFDVDLDPRLGIDLTTFDMTYEFTVNAYNPLTSSSGSENPISVFKTFSITVVREFNAPYERLYIKAMPPEDDRTLVSNLLLNQDIFPVDAIYRGDDANFGVAKNIIYDHAYGLVPNSLDAYAESLYLNHYWKNLTLGEIRSARALDSNGNILYEVIYSIVVDNLVNDQGQSVSKEVTLPYPVQQDDSTEITTVYPNSLINMRDQVVDQIGQVSPALPLWMTSKQENGRVLGFVPAWVMAYVKPGRAGQILYNIKENFGEQLNLVDFKADRYELDRSMTYDWDSADDQWIPSPAESTVFDLTTEPLYVIPSLGIDGRIVRADSAIANGTETVFSYVPVYSSYVLVQIDGITQPSSAYTISYGFRENTVTFTTPPPYNSNVTMIQIADPWVLNPNSIAGDPTVFDGGSTTFGAPSNDYAVGDRFDKYLLFPRINILSDINQGPPLATATWTNNGQQIVTWVNEDGQVVTWLLNYP